MYGKIIEHNPPEHAVHLINTNIHREFDKTNSKMPDIGIGHLFINQERSQDVYYILHLSLMPKFWVLY